MSSYSDAIITARYPGVHTVTILQAGQTKEGLTLIKLGEHSLAMVFRDGVLYVKNHAALAMAKLGWKFDPAGVFAPLNHVVASTLTTQMLEKKVNYLDIAQLIKIATAVPRLRRGELQNLYVHGKGISAVEFDNNILLSLFMYLPGFIDLWDENVDKDLIHCMDITIDIPQGDEGDLLFACQEDFEFLILMAVLSNDKLLTPENSGSMSARYTAYYFQNQLAAARELPEVFQYFNQNRLAAFHGFLPDVVKPGLINILKNETYGAVCGYAYRLLEGSGMTMITFTDNVLTGTTKLRGFMTTKIATEIIKFSNWVKEKKLKHGEDYMYLKYVCPEELRSMTQDTYKHLFALMYKYGFNTMLKNYRSKLLDSVKIDDSWIIPLVGYEDDCESLDPELKLKVMQLLQIKKINPDPSAMNAGTLATLFELAKNYQAK